MKDDFSEIYNLSQRLDCLNQEILELSARIKPQDCGHLKTTVGVLKDRALEIRGEMLKLKLKNSSS